MRFLIVDDSSAMRRMIINTLNKRSPNWLRIRSASSQVARQIVA
ncbi:MAG TPA: hypothetical protein VIZ32_15195 [Vicinamibacterales bacterium]